jgi:hypothetical protein
MKRRPALLTCALVMSCSNFGEPPPPTLWVSPPTLTFTSWLGGLGPPLQPLTVDLRGAGVVPWQARADVPWLQIEPAEGTVPTVAWVTAALQGLPAGTHQGRLRVAAGDDSAVVNITFVVRARPTLTGRWAFAADSMNVGMSLQDSAGAVRGEGNFNPAGGQRRLFTVQGTASLPALTLTLTQTDGTTVTLTGTLRSDNVIDAVLDGGSFRGAGVTLFRQ